MRLIITTFLVIFLSSFASTQTPIANNKTNEGEKLVVDKLASNPTLYPKRFSQIAWVADKSMCYYVNKNTLYTYDVKKKKTNEVITLKDFCEIIHKEECKNNLGNVDDYKCQKLTIFPKIINATNDYFLVYNNNCFSVLDIKKGNLAFHASIPKKAKNLSFNPDLTSIAFTIDNNLQVLVDQLKFAITKDVDKGIVNGQVVHRNEFGINKGIFWSELGDKLAFYRMDESMVYEYPLTSFTKNGTDIQYTRYPEAGKTSHQVQLGIYNTGTFETFFLEPFEGKSNDDMYITSVTWSKNDKYIYTTRLTREQKHLYLVCHDATTGKLVNVLFEEINNIYVEPETNIKFLPNGNEFIYLSEKSGFNHIYLYDVRGNLIKNVTPKDEKWMVNSIVGFSNNEELIYFMATKDGPIESNLYSVNINSGEIIRITKNKGKHHIIKHPKEDLFIDIYTNHEMGRCTQIIDNNGDIKTNLLKDVNPLANFDMPNTYVFKIKADDGVTDLYARLILPKGVDFDTSSVDFVAGITSENMGEKIQEKIPAIVYVYGGPHAQMITDSYLFGSSLFLQFLAQEGYAVLTVDNRGSDNRGFDFETSIHRNIGDVETKDQMKGVEFLKSLDFIDPERIGVDGWSYGGFMAISLKLKYPGVFKVATAGGPVINWEWYEVMYGERYMSTPQNNPVGYENANLLNYVDSLEGKLMLIHGALDDVVLPKNSINFVEECINKGKQVDFFLYPQHKHNVRGKERNHLLRKIYEYYKANL